MNDLRKAAEMALEALEWNYGTDLENIENCMAWLDKMNATIPALRQALAQPEQEPVADNLIRTYVSAVMANNQNLAVEATKGMVDYVCSFIENTAPPKREWVGLTDEEKKRFVVAYFVDKYDRETAVTLMDDYEAILKEKNGG